MVYYDGMQNDARMNVGLAISAMALGAVVVNHMEVVELSKNGEGQLKGAVVKDTETGEVLNVKAKVQY